MKIGVLLKQVPDTESKIRLNGDANGIEEGDIKWIISPYDEFAVEEALKLKSTAGAEEVVGAGRGEGQLPAGGAERAARVRLVPLTAKRLSKHALRSGYVQEEC